MSIVDEAGYLPFDRQTFRPIRQTLEDLLADRRRIPRTRTPHRERTLRRIERCDERWRG
ncbi:hypothetical protein [Nocardia cyriacigeorgica]|uniref:Uncharacterized protein n=1 Tax=Nocardia cyriacigeorgica TaxID=135487 RepID=A0A4U8VV30_9NOCA|nr:hypothetical protein [Nocardia cyriacigeorgica]VFA96415.1 Uncharacterised protein [Nocardia cyriacigeorgica]